jgi:glutamyl-tRNA synthetase
MSEILDLYNYVLPNFEINKEIELGAVDKNKLLEFLTYYSSNYSQLESNQDWFNDLKEKALKFNFVDNKMYKQNPTAFAGSVSDAAKFVRVAITGRENSPELFSIMKILGTNECVERINKLISIIK